MFIKLKSCLPQLTCLKKGVKAENSVQWMSQNSPCTIPTIPAAILVVCLETNRFSFSCLISCFAVQLWHIVLQPWFP